MRRSRILEGVSVAAAGLLLVASFVTAHRSGNALAEEPAARPSNELHHVVRLSLRVEGNGEAVRLELPLPQNDRHQRITEESLNSRGFTVEEVERDGNRLAILRHPGFTGRKRISYEFHARTTATKVDWVPAPPARAHPQSEDWRWLRPTVRIQSASPLLRERLARFAAPRLAAGENDAIAIAWDLASTGFERREKGSKGMLRALRTGHASDLALERLFVAFLRASGVPARPVIGLDLRQGRGPSMTSWAEVKSGGKWAPMSVGAGFQGKLPARKLKLAHGDLPFVAREGVRSLRYRWKITEVEVEALAEP